MIILQLNYRKPNYTTQNVKCVQNLEKCLIFTIDQNARTQIHIIQEAEHSRYTNQSPETA